MGRSIFGWSYPPGCSHLPWDEPDRPCVLCGEGVDICECPECEKCGTVDCVEHMSDHDLLGQIDLRRYQLSELETELDRRQRTRKWTCPKCGKEEPADIRNGH